MDSHYLCKKMFVDCDRYNCNRSHSQDELKIHFCIYDNSCKNEKCPFIHSGDEFISNNDYYKRMLKYINPYNSYKTSICRYTIKGCKFENCRKAHNEEELTISKCDCFRKECPFYHESRDINISKKEYYQRMAEFCKITNNNNKNLLCRYIHLECKRPNCPYAHNIDELEIHKCIFKTCKTKNCPFLHNGEKIEKIQYFNRISKYIKPFDTKTICCENKNCKIKNCKYAHSEYELKQTYCIRENCKRTNCPFLHDRKIDTNIYYDKMLKSILASMFPN